MIARNQMHGWNRGHRTERGQILVLFTLAIVAVIAMVGLVIDGGATFAQRRSQQNAADLAAIAGANAYLNTNGSVAARTAAAIAAARAAASRNGYVDGTASTSVPVSVTLLSAGARVNVGVQRPHDNTFARIVPGQGQWPVSVVAAADTGTIDTAIGAAPWIMHIDAFNGDGSPKFTESNPQDFGEVNGDYPVGPLDIAWTDYNGSNNVNTNEVRQIIQGDNIVTATFDFGQYIGQHNQGNHTALYSEVDTHLSGTDVPIPITGPCPAPNQSNQGCFKGWAMFHVISAQGGSAKDITGWFWDEGFHAAQLTVGECTPAQQAAGSCGVITTSGPFDDLIVRLTQ
jgi:Flp pilus assembly protein TadG